MNIRDFFEMHPVWLLPGHGKLKKGNEPFEWKKGIKKNAETLELIFIRN